jgi:hypothetical protein
MFNLGGVAMHRADSRNPEETRTRRTVSLRAALAGLLALTCLASSARADEAA